jgi:hypothetical protein
MPCEKGKRIHIFSVFILFLKTELAYFYKSVLNSKYNDGQQEHTQRK